MNFIETVIVTWDILIVFFVVLKVLQIGAEVNEFDFDGQLLLIKQQMVKVIKSYEV